MKEVTIWDRLQSQRIASALRRVQGAGAVLGFGVGVGVTYAIAPLFARLIAG